MQNLQERFRSNHHLPQPMLEAGYGIISVVVDIEVRRFEEFDCWCLVPVWP